MFLLLSLSFSSFVESSLNFTKKQVQIIIMIIIIIVIIILLIIIIKKKKKRKKERKTLSDKNKAILLCLKGMLVSRE